jgi:hypothetical protein
MTAEIFSVSFILVYVKHQIQSNFRGLLKENKINTNQVEKIFIDKQTLENKSSYFHRTDKDEFEYLGKMYDIISKDVQKEGTIFYCISDSKEDLLLHNFQNIQNENDSPVKTKLFNLIKTCLKLMLQQFIEVNHLKFITDNNHDFGMYKRFYYLNIAPDITTPPPED